MKTKTTRHLPAAAHCSHSRRSTPLGGHLGPVPAWRQSARPVVLHHSALAIAAASVAAETEQVLKPASAAVVAGAAAEEAVAAGVAAETVQAILPHYR